MCWTNAKNIVTRKEKYQKLDKDKENELKKEMEKMIYCIQNSLAILLTHIVIFLHISKNLSERERDALRHRIKDDVRVELDAFVVKVKRESDCVRKILDAQHMKDMTNFLDVLRQYLQNIFQKFNNKQK